MGLKVRFTHCIDSDDHSQIMPMSWCVATTQCVYLGEFEFAVAPGFLRRKDADIALRVLQDMDIDWDAEPDDFWRQIDSHGGKEEVRKHVYRHLQW